MTTADMDYLLEDTTGRPTDTDFCDVHDRRFLRVRTTAARTVRVFDCGAVRPRVISAEYPLSSAVLVLPHPAAGGGGSVQYEGWPAPVPADAYLTRPRFSRSAGRSFTMSDGQVYKWAPGAADGEWTCTNAQRYSVAHYDRPPSPELVYKNSSGNALTICDSFTHLTVEIVTSLILMRHIAQRS